MIEERLQERTAQGIASAVGSAISDGVAAPGDKLPTVRALAVHLQVSASTVSDAWQILKNHGMVTTDRRRGTTVRSTRAGLGGRYWQVPVEPGTIDLDLSTGTPDSQLLPPLGPVLHQLHADVTVTSYVDPPLLAGLEAELRRRWPFEPEALTVVDGAQDALDRTVSELVSLGDTVVVEDPTFPPLLDMLELAGARIVGVPLDSHGPRVAALGEAMAASPVALFIQPRAHNPTGVRMSRGRVKAIAKLVSGSRVIVVEDDHSGSASGVPLESVGAYAPANTLHIRSFSKSHGPDLRIAAIGGPAEVVHKITARRQLGPSWTSRLIQTILLTMLTDPRTEECVAAAADQYLLRRRSLAELLATRNTPVMDGVGLNVWIPVEDEQRAVVALAAQGIGVAPGRPFRVHAGAEQHIRLSVGSLRGEIEAVAEAVAAAAARPPSQIGL